jgi:hypothetical protein
MHVRYTERMHLFVMILKKKSTIFLMMNVASMAVFLSTVEPNITRPLSIMGFFAMLVLLVSSIAYVVLYGLKPQARRLVWSAAFSLYVAYLLALGSLRLFSLPQLALASLAVATLLFIVERSYSR